MCWFSKPLQFVHSNVDIPLEIHSTTVKEEQKNEFIKSCIDKEKNNLLNIQSPPLFRFKVVVCEDDSFFIFFTFHHALLDGWSVALLMTTLITHYDKLLNNKTIETEENDFEYGEYVLLENKMSLDKRKK